jgi:hypothetical protein
MLSKVNIPVPTPLDQQAYHCPSCGNFGNDYALALNRFVGQYCSKSFTHYTVLVEIKLEHKRSIELRCLYSLTVMVLNVVKSWNGKKDLLLKDYKACR